MLVLVAGFWMLVLVSGCWILDTGYLDATDLDQSFSGLNSPYGTRKIDGTVNPAINCRAIFKSPYGTEYSISQLTSSIQHSEPSIQHPASSIQHPASSIIQYP
jgi:hypothetical protein